MDYIDYDERLRDIENKINNIRGGKTIKDNVIKINNYKYNYYFIPVIIFIGLLIIKPSFCKNKDGKNISKKKCLINTIIISVVIYYLYKYLFSRKTKII